MRVTVVSTSFPATPGSSSGVFVERLVSHLPGDLNVSVLTPCPTERPIDGGDRSYRLTCFRYGPWRWQRLAHQPGGVPVALAGAPWLRLLLPVFLLSMFVSCLRQCSRADILHANWSINGVIAGIAGRLRHTPVITTLRGEDVSRAGRSLLFRVMLGWCLRLSSRVVCVSRAIEDLLHQHYPKLRDKVVFIPNGVEASLLEIPRDPGLSAQHRALQVVAIGSLIPRKGIDVLIEALAELQRSSAVHVQIVGDGPLRSQLKAHVEQSGVAEIVEFVGAVAPDRVKDYLAMADVLVLPSWAEGRPNVVLEAFGAGLPVIGSAIDGVRELVADGVTGILFPPGDSRRLAEALESLGADRARMRQMGIAARGYISDNRLLWPDAGAAYAALYREVVVTY